MKIIRFLKSLRGRYLLVLLGLTALPTLLIGGLAYRNARQTIVSRVEAQLTSVADLKEEQIANWIGERQADVRLIADNFLNEEHFTEILDPTVDPQRRDSFAGFITDNLISIQQTRQGYNEIFFIDTSGEIIISTSENNVGRNFSWHPVTTQVFESDTGSIIYDIHEAQDTGEIEMIFANVIHKVDLETFEVLDEVNGAVIIRVDMEETIYPLIRAWPGMGDSGETLLARADGEETLFLNPLRFDMDSALNLRVPRSSEDAKPAHKATMGQEGIIQTTDYRGVMVLAAYRNIPEIGWGFVAKEDLSEAFVPIAQLTQQWVIVTAVILIVAVAVAVLSTERLTNPLNRLVKASQSVAAGNLDTQITVSGEDEIGILGRSFQTMITAVRESNEELRAHSEELRSLFNLSQTLLGTLDVDEMLHSSLSEAITGSTSEAGAILLVDNERREVFTRSVIGLPKDILGRRFPIDAHTAPGFALTRKNLL